MRVVVRWGDCDEAGIVYYPNYLYWMDSAYHAKLDELGWSMKSLRQDLGGATPLVEVGASFKAPATYNDELQITLHVAHWGRTSFRLEYVGKCAEKTVFTGFEARVWLSTDNQNGVSTAPVPQVFKDKLSHGGD